jgi:hypothetical protein
VTRIVREVGVHLDDALRARRERVPEARQVGLPEPALAGPVEHLDDAELRADALGDRAGAVRRGVVDDEDAMVLRRRLREHLGDAAQQPLDRSGLVICRHDHPGGGRHEAGKRSRPLARDGSRTGRVRRGP